MKEGLFRQILGLFYFASHSFSHHEFGYTKWSHYLFLSLKKCRFLFTVPYILPTRFPYNTFKIFRVNLIATFPDWEAKCLGLILCNKIKASPFPREIFGQNLSEGQSFGQICTQSTSKFRTKSVLKFYVPTINKN